MSAFDLRLEDALTCERCHVEFCAVRIGRKPRRFCSRACATRAFAPERFCHQGDAHYRWQGDSVSERGGRARALRMYPAVGACSKCGAEKAERHHRDGDTSNNDPSNIEIVCRRCHMEEDGRLREVAEQMRRIQPMGVAARW